MATIAWEYYLKKAQQAVQGLAASRVLKMDVDNEINGHPIEGGIAGNLPNCVVMMVEVRAERIQEAKSLLVGKGVFEFYCADIRALPFQDNSFDIILDLSTLDHIPPTDVSEVLEDYARIAPMLLLVVWLTDGTPSKQGAEWSPEDQYYFDPVLVEGELAKHYTILEEDKSFFRLGDNFLAYYLCQRKETL